MNKLREIFEKDVPIGSYKFAPELLTDEAKELIFGKPSQDVLYDVTFGVEAPKRTHRKRRIRKKWVKRYGTKTVYVTASGKFEPTEDGFTFTGYPYRYGDYCHLGGLKARDGLL